MNERAVQFAPFAALNGYFDMIGERSTVPVLRRERTQEENESLSQRILSLKRGDRVTAVFYTAENLTETLTGTLGFVDLIMRSLTVDKRKILLDDLVSLKKEFNRTD